MGLTKSLQEVDPDFLKTTSPHTLIVQFTGHRLATWRLTRCDNFMTTPDTLGPAASSQVYGPTENSCFFRWPPLLWTGQNLQVCSDAYRKRPASWQPKSLLITIEQARQWFNSKISWLFFFSAWLLGFRRLHLLQTYRNIIKQIYLFECVLLAIWRNQTQHPEQSKGRQAFRFVLVCSSGIKQPYLISAKSSGYSHQILAEFVFVLGDNGWTVYSF